MKETVTMQSPSGEVREAEATPEALTPLMAAGWHQHHPASKAETAPAQTEETK